MLLQRLKTTWHLRLAPFPQFSVPNQLGLVARSQLLAGLEPAQKRTFASSLCTFGFLAGCNHVQESLADS